MRKIIGAASLILFLICLGLRAADEKAPKPVPPTPAEIPELVKQLGDDDYAKRNAAESRLALAGPAAEAALSSVKDSQDLEIRTRAGRLLGAIKTGPILAKMEAANLGGQNFEADMLVNVSMMQMKTEMKSHIKMMADGTHYSMEMENKTAGMNMKMKMVADGKTVWTETELPDNAPPIPGANGGKMVQKYSIEAMKKLNGGKSGNPLMEIAEMRNMFNFTDVKEGKVGTDDVYILEGTVKDDAAEKNNPANAMMANSKRARISVLKSSMVLRKMEMLDDKGEAAMSFELINVKLGEKFDEKMFSYKPPEGAQVNDLDEALKGAAANAGAVQIEEGIDIPCP